MTDQRRETRHRERLSVELTHDGQYLGRFKTRDTCPHGAFVEATATGLATGDVVTLSFVATGQVAHRQIRIAEVSRVNEHGIGVSYAAPCVPAEPDAPPGAESTVGR